jgi:hypothetical protein
MAGADELAALVKNRGTNRNAAFSQPFAGFRYRHCEHRGMIKMTGAGHYPQ